MLWGIWKVFRRVEFFLNMSKYGFGFEGFSNDPTMFRQKLKFGSFFNPTFIEGVWWGVRAFQKKDSLVRSRSHKKEAKVWRESDKDDESSKNSVLQKGRRHKST